MEWPIFFKDSLVVGDKRNNVAICCLWSKKERYILNDFCIIGNLYTGEGVNYIIKNIAANPFIRYIIVTGRDLTSSKKVLINFFKYGVKNGKIIGTNIFIHSNISMDIVERIRRNVKVIEVKNKREIETITKNLKKFKKPFCKPITMVDENIGEESFTSGGGFFFQGSIGDVWLRIIDTILKFGELKESQHSLKQKEVIGVCSVIYNFRFTNFFNIEKEYLKRYIKEFLSPKRKKDVSYTYGNRIFAYTLNIKHKFEREFEVCINQIENVIRKLKKCKNSRRAVVCIYNPLVDIESNNPPCLTQIFFSINNNKLYLSAFFRSHDIYGAYLLNSFALRELQKIVAKNVGIKVGDVIIFSQSAHIYENCLKKAKDIVSKELKIMKFEKDKSGYFRIWLENGEIVVQHYFVDGKKSKYVFRGKDSIKLYRKILQNNLVSRIDHAAYLGKELSRAEMCLKRNEKYVQDKA